MVSTNELRWIRREVYDLPRNSHTLVLQQAWLDDFGTTKWKDVPTYETIDGEDYEWGTHPSHKST